MPGDTAATERIDEEPEPMVVTFKSRDEPEFQKPDHDPHGETCAAAAHSTASCDRCGKSGVVPTANLEYASGFVGGPEREVICEDCA
ncbi:hypothetical protein [Halohasta litorea]|uniref:Small CPxCG-related zinc finger protein n=1 Tax=Halohasta litorea TaxID=869891 RepID=A0ABD6DAR7_9EURY|nr:hypothetical protein [Halohasta litorea]